MIEDLPLELIWRIVCELPSQADLKRLSETSKQLRGIVARRLFNTITLSAKDFGIKNFIEDVSRVDLIPPICLEHAKHIAIKAPFYGQREERCLHWRIPKFKANYDQDFVYEQTSCDPFQNIMKGVETLISSLRTGQLCSFAWELGTCLPNLGDFVFEDILKLQRNIENISLITDPVCGSNRNTPFYLDLCLLEKIRFLSWKGPIRDDEFLSLNKCFQKTGKTIETLTLDLIESGEVAEYQVRIFPEPDNYFARNILGIKDGLDLVLFPALTTLSLSAVSFESTEKEIAHAMGMTTLRVLKLRDCPYSLDLLDVMTKSGGMTSLKSLELTLTFAVRNQHNLHQDEVIKPYLEAFQGLEDLFLALPEPTNWDSIVEGVDNHKTTLRRLVIHARASNEGRTLHDTEPKLSTRAQSILKNTRLRCLGISRPRSGANWSCDLADVLMPNCKMLHVRATGEEIEGDGKTYFTTIGERTHGAPTTLNHSGSAGPQEIIDLTEEDSETRLPALQVFAFGDFSYENRYANSNVLVCRDETQTHSTTSYRVRALTPKDHDLMNLVRDNMEMLAACPIEPLMNFVYRSDR